MEMTSLAAPEKMNNPLPEDDYKIKIRPATRGSQPHNCTSYSTTLDDVVCQTNNLTGLANWF